MWGLEKVSHFPLCHLWTKAARLFLKSFCATIGTQSCTHTCTTAGNHVHTPVPLQAIMYTHLCHCRQSIMNTHLCRYRQLHIYMLTLECLKNIFLRLLASSEGSTDIKPDNTSSIPETQNKTNQIPNLTVVL